MRERERAHQTKRIITIYITNRIQYSFERVSKAINTNLKNIKKRKKKKKQLNFDIHYFIARTTLYTFSF